MRSLRRTLAACLALALAGCDLGGDVPKERLPRFVEHHGPAPRVALVLGSGGPRGFAHIGVLKALEDSGIKPDLILGSSVGSMVGVFYAAGLSAHDLERLAYELDFTEFFELRTLVGAVGTGSAVQKYVNAHVKGLPIEELKIPFAAAATRLADGKLVLFNRGDAGLAVRASSASLGQFEPVTIGGQAYIDSDELSPVPIRAARQLGARMVIAVDVSAFAEDTPQGVPAAWIQKDARRARQVAAEAAEADVLLHPNIGYYAGFSENYRRRVIAIAEQATRERLPAIRAALARAGVPLPQTASTARMPPGDASR
jgi:NTE family protein